MTDPIHPQFIEHDLNEIAGFKGRLVVFVGHRSVDGPDLSHARQRANSGLLAAVAGAPHAARSDLPPARP